MNGAVDHAGRALLSVTLRATTASQPQNVDVWIDTGFTGEIVVPQAFIEQLKLPQSGSIDAVLADGSQVELNTYSCTIDWFGSQRNLEVVGNNGQFPLLGVGLLLGLELRIDYRSLQLSLTPASAT
jgi:clan AA aspartic protease